MPIRGYRTLMLRIDFYGLIEGYAQGVYPGVSLNSAILRARKELEAGEFQVSMHEHTLREASYEGKARYASVTISDEVVSWLRSMMAEWEDRYRERYGQESVKTLGTFSNWFLANLFLSKEKSLERVIRLKPEDYDWLNQEYNRRRKEFELKYGVHTFEQFLPVYIKETLERIRGAKELLKQVLD